MNTLPGHPVKEGAGYDCCCGACLSLPARKDSAATEIAPVTLRYMAGKCICSARSHGHAAWYCPGDAIAVPTNPHAHRCVACWGRVPSEVGWPADV